MDKLMHSRIFFSKDKKIPRYSVDWSDAAETVESQLVNLGCEVKFDKLPAGKMNRMRRAVVKHKSSGKLSSGMAPTSSLALCRAAIGLSYKIPFDTQPHYTLRRTASF